MSSQFQAQGRRGPNPRLKRTDPDGSLSHSDQLGSTGASQLAFHQSFGVYNALS
jgi:hypothetical protein